MKYAIRVQLSAKCVILFCFILFVQEKKMFLTNLDMDGWLTCDFTSFLQCFSNIRTMGVILKSCAQ